MRYLLITIVAIFMAGCTSPSTPVTNYKPMAASAITLAVLKKAPAPTPDSGKCPDCNGTGKVGDGVVMVKCKSCNGTGKIGSVPPYAPGSLPTGDVVEVGVETPEVAVVNPEPSQEVCGPECENGACETCNEDCPQCVSGGYGSTYAPRLFWRWRR